MGKKHKIIVGHMSRIARGIILGMMILVGVLVLVIIGNSVIRGDKIDPNDPRPMGPLFNYMHPNHYGCEHTNENTEWHGREGESEYGEYMDRDGVEKGVALDPIASDEEHMWIGKDGDTIWE